MKKEIILSNNKKEEMDINEVLDKYKKLVYSICNKWYSTYGEDIQQEGFVGLTKAFNTYDSSKGLVFTTYATRVIQNEIYMYNRKNVKTLANLSTTSNEEFNFEDMIVDQNNLEKSVIENDTLKEILSWINTELNSREKEVLKYLYFGKTQKEISKIMSVTQGYISHVKKRILTRAKKKFGQDLLK